MPPRGGMLFILPLEQVVTVTAADMLFPIGVIFIGGDFKVTEVIPLLSPGERVTGTLACQYFLEVNAGEADEINPGDVVSMSELPSSNSLSSLLTPVIALAGISMVGVFTTRMSKTAWEKAKGKLLLSRTVPPQPLERPNQTARPAVIPEEKRSRREGDLEFLPDSPEFLAYTIDDIGYREKIGAAFLEAIGRSRKKAGLLEKTYEIDVEG